MVTRVASLTDKGTHVAYTEGAGRILNSKQNTMEDAASGQPNYKAKKKKTEKGNEKRWWHVELFFFFFFVLCVSAIYHSQTTTAIKIMRNRFVTFNWLAFFRFHDGLTQNYEPEKKSPWRSGKSEEFSFHFER